jgi:hypothetical protein
MSKGITGLLVIAALAVGAGSVLLLQDGLGSGGGGGGGGGGNLASATVMITLNDKTCSIDQTPSIKVNDTIHWQESHGYAFSVDFQHKTALDPGTPFRDSKKNLQFSFSTADPDTGGAVLGLFQGSKHNFLLQTIKVVPTGGTPVTCYNYSANPIPGMKVIVTQ